MTAPKAKTQFVVGSLYTTDGTDLWKLTEYKPEPELKMVKMGDNGKQDPIKEGPESTFKGFVRLVPEVDPPARPKRKYERKTVGVDAATGKDQS